MYVYITRFVGHFLGKSMPSTTFTHQSRRAVLQQRLKNTIKKKNVIRREMKVGKQIDLHITSECECCICLETLKPNNIAIPPCGHKYCFTCLMENAKVSRACPLCREIIVPELPRRNMSDEKLGETIANNLALAVDEILDIQVQEDNSHNEEGSSDLSSCGYDEDPSQESENLVGDELTETENNEDAEESHEDEPNVEESDAEEDYDEDDDDDEFLNELIEDIKERRETFNETHEEIFKIMYYTVHSACVDMCEFYEK